MAGASSASGFAPHLPGLRYKLLSKGLGAAMWFFIFYRAREDGSKLLFGLGPQLEKGRSHGVGSHH